MIEYQAARPATNDIIALIFQGGYGLAHGPKGNIKIMGTYGMESCLGVGIVVRRPGETYPRIAVGHFDTSTIIAPSADAMLDGIDYRRGERGQLFFESASASPEFIRSVLHSLPAEYFTLQSDLSRRGTDGLYFDLTNGAPINPDYCAGLHGYGVPDPIIEERALGGPRVRREPLILDFDMREGIPASGLEFYLSKANPNQSPSLQPKL